MNPDSHHDGGVEFFWTCSDLGCQERAKWLVVVVQTDGEKRPVPVCEAHADAPQPLPIPPRWQPREWTERDNLEMLTAVFSGKYDHLTVAELKKEMGHVR